MEDGRQGWDKVRMCWGGGFELKLSKLVKSYGDETHKEDRSFLLRAVFKKQGGRCPFKC